MTAVQNDDIEPATATGRCCSRTGIQRRPHGGAVHLGHLAAESRGFERRAVRREGVRDDDLRSGPDVLLVDSLHCVGLRQVGPRTPSQLVHRHALSLQLAAALSDAFAARPDPGAVPAASVAVFVDEQEVVEAWGVPACARFQAASISKPVAAIATLRLAADGLVELDADVNQFLTSWQLPGDAGAVPVTVRHLICHGGGLSVEGFPGYRQDDALPSLTDMLDGVPPSNTRPVRRDGPVGADWRYSGGGYLVLQQLLEDVTGRDFAELAAELVLRPAGMTTASYAQPNPADAAAPHVQGRRVAWHVYPEQAAAGLWCTPTDLLHLGQAIQAALAGEAEALLPAGLARRMLTPQLGDWGLGLKISGEGDGRVFSHGGETYGYQCAMLGAVDGRNTVAVMTSSEQGVPVLEALAAAITASSSWQITRFR
jgi:CubicO group peptidase (beta-lactamase class C family)